MDFEEIHDWICIRSPGRWDAFNYNDIKKNLDELKERAHKIAIRMHGIEFVSLPSIKLIYALAVELQLRGGRLALIGVSEKMKRQIAIYASLEPIDIFTSDNWERLVNTRLVGKA